MSLPHLPKSHAGFGTGAHALKFDQLASQVGAFRPEAVQISVTFFCPYVSSRLIVLRSERNLEDLPKGLVSRDTLLQTKEVPPQTLHPIRCRSSPTHSFGRTAHNPRLLKPAFASALSASSFPSTKQVTTLLLVDTSATLDPPESDPNLKYFSWRKERSLRVAISFDDESRRQPSYPAVKDG